MFIQTFFLPNLLFVVVSALIPSKEKIHLADRDIHQLIVDNKLGIFDYPFIGGLVRLAFHDCIGEGGCDGCLDHAHPANGGLKKYTDKLDALFMSKNYEMSRADFYAFSSIVALELSTSKVTVKFTGRSQFKFGRISCETSPIEDAPNNFPRGQHGIDITLRYFQTEFPDFSTNEVVALLGAHTVGRSRAEDGGHEGRWVDSKTETPFHWLTPQSTLDNQYYRELVIPWKQLALPSGLLQWHELFEKTANDGSMRNSPDQPSMLMNSDFCFVWNYTATNEAGAIDCNTNCKLHRFASIVFDVTTDGPCCNHSSTYRKVIEYAIDNALWVKDFTDVFMKMISRNSNVNGMIHIDSIELVSDVFSQALDDFLSNLV